MNIRSFLKNLLKNKALLICIFLLIIFKLPSLFEPTWYGDEGIYATIGNEMNHGELLYKDVWDNKTPFIYYTYGTIIKFFGVNQFFFRFAGLISAIIALIFFYKLFILIFANNFTKRKDLFFLIPGILFAFFIGSPILEGNIANAENFFTTFSLIGLYYAIKYTNERKGKNLALFGLFFGIAFMFKTLPIFEIIPAYIFIYLYTGDFTTIKDAFRILLSKKLLISVSFFALPAIVMTLLFLFQGNLSDFINMLMTQGRSYATLSPNASLGFIVIKDSLPLRTLLLGLGSVILIYGFLKGYFNNKFNFFIVLLFLFSAYSVMFSGRSFAHYLLQIVASFILLGTMFYNLVKGKNIFVYTKYFVFLFFISTFFFQLFYKGLSVASPTNTLSYYSNFIKFQIGSIDTKKYYSTLKDLDANSINQLVEDTKFLKNKEVFVADEIPWYYALADASDAVKYTALYHTVLDKADMNKFVNDLRNKAEYIIINSDKFSSYDSRFQQLINKDYTYVSTSQQYKVYRIIK